MIMFPSAAQTLRAFRFRQVLLHVNVTNNDRVSEKSNNFVVVADSKTPFSTFM